MKYLFCMELETKDQILKQCTNKITKITAIVSAVCLFMEKELTAYNKEFIQLRPVLSPSEGPLQYGGHSPSNSHPSSTSQTLKLVYINLEFLESVLAARIFKRKWPIKIIPLSLYQCSQLPMIKTQIQYLKKSNFYQ